MTLFRQLLIAILIAMVLLYIGNIAVSISNSKTLVANQMRIHAQDAATSIALSMTQSARSDDIVGLETILNAVSDTGFYQRIYFSDIKGNLLIDRGFAISIGSVPSWFVSFIDLPIYQGVAEVSSGWSRLGTLVVVSHPGQAYKNLWHIAVVQLAWFALVSAAATALVSLVIARLLTPLQGIEEQANAICRQEFVEQKTIPATRELASVVKAMNRMSAQLHSLFNGQLILISDLRQKIHCDELTGLSNRADFDARLNSCVGDELGKHSGVLMIFAVQQLAHINEIAGRMEGNAVLKSVADTLSTALADYEQAVIARRQGCEFSVFISDIARDEAKSLAETLFAKVELLSWVGQPDQPLTMHMGFTYSGNVSNGPELLSEADMVLRSFSQKNKSEWGDFADIEGANAPLVYVSAIDWREFARETIAQQKVQLNVQAMFDVADRNLLGYEVFSSFPDNKQGPDFAARIVMPELERAGLAVEFDQLVLNELRGKWAGRSDPLSVNIGLSSVMSEQFHAWFAAFCKDNPVFASQLTCELPERMLRLAEQDIRAFQAMLSQHGVGLAIDGFGLGTSEFAYLGSLPLRYLKVHRSFTRNIASQKDNQFYIKALVQLAKTRALSIIAEGVESQEDWDTLVTLDVGGGQGYLFAYPQAIQQDLQQADESTI